MMTDLQAESFAASLFTPRPYQATRRHIRGQKRYYQKVQHKAQSFSRSLELKPGYWSDFWHFHVDWPGYGNLGWKHRRSHLKALSIIFESLICDTANYYQPYQIWLYLDPIDAGQDAVYLHTPNPNKDNFPWKPQDIVWPVPALEQYLGRFLSVPLRAGKGRGTDGTSYYVVYSSAHGMPLE